MPPTVLSGSTGCGPWRRVWVVNRAARESVRARHRPGRTFAGREWSPPPDRRALSNTNSESFWPRSAAARLRIAFASAEARIWIISSLRRADAGRASLLLSRGLCRKGKRDRFGHTAFGLLQIFVPVLVEDRALRVDGGDISAALTVDDMDHKLAQPPAAQM